MNRDRSLGFAAITLASLLWATTGTAATFAPSVGPLAIGAAALGIGGLLQAVVAPLALKRAAPLLRANLGTVMAGAVAVGIYPLAFYSSMHFAGVAIGTVVSLASAPVISGLLEKLVDGKPLGAWWMLSAALGVVGCVMLCTSDLLGRTSDLAPTVTGIALGLIAGVSYATYAWAAHRLMGRGIGRSAAMGSVFGGGGLLLMPVLFITGAPIIASTESFLVTTYMVLVTMFLGYLLFGYGLTKVPASTATAITLIEPAGATVLAVLIVGERLSALGWLGLAMFAAVLLVLALAPAPSAPSTGLIPELGATLPGPVPAVY
ncbi:MAG: EamA family transporter [Nakamurella sp.]